MPGRASELLRSEIDDDGRDGTFRGIWAIILGFSRLGEYIGEGEASEAKWGPHAIARRGSHLGRTLLWCGALGCDGYELVNPKRKVMI